MTRKNTAEDVIRIAREGRPHLWRRTEQVARIIDPGAFMDDWEVSPPDIAALLASKLAYQRAAAMSRAQEVLKYLGVNTDTDWHLILTRMAEESREGKPPMSSYNPPCVKGGCLYSCVADCAKAGAPVTSEKE